MENQVHDHYFTFNFRTEDNGYNRRLGYICVASKKDGDNIFVTIAGSACSVSEPKFLKWKGTALAKGRVDCPRPHINKIETTLEEANKLDVREILKKLKLRPTCEYMDSEQEAETNRRWDNIDYEDADEWFKGSLDDIEVSYDVDFENEELDSTRGYVGQDTYSLNHK